ncbi:Pkinase-domain-containing protein [Trichodelitschia bisporula]|uniref:non-specific serine/threonine protein kinase n=1 Tax=Trichodelitschia bisporula TaxID=703511 RepID=A0A6G1HHV8_9PEZI|nr:Pkinase-domain-containing protein [Trichodelitschia bisporula]
MHTEADTSLLSPTRVPYSSDQLNRYSAPRQGITWGPNITEDGTQIAQRKRSASTEHVTTMNAMRKSPNAEGEEPTTEPLIFSFSKGANEGAGLKARRLSTSLPEQFYVDYCELEKEFKSSSLIPLRRGHCVGKGATAKVTVMLRKGGAKDVLFAVKEFRGKDKSEDAEEYIKKVQSEFTIAKSLHHPNIVETVRLCKHKDRWNHVMEYCQLGELYGLVDKSLFKTFYKLTDRLCFFKQLLRGVDYLHSHGIAHRDIKLENLLLTADGHLKITDFGVSEVFSGEHPGLRSAGGQCGKNMGAVRRCAPGICGSLPYIAPEVLEKRGDYDPRPLDIWSCAIVFLTMTYSGSPWSAAREDSPFYASFKKGWDTWLAKNPDGIITDQPGGAPMCGPLFNADRLGSPALKRLLLKMMHPDPDRRISVKEILASPYVRGIECCSPESDEEQQCCIDAADKKAFSTAARKMTIVKKHNHIPPREHRTPKALQHRFDMGDGYN